MNKEIIKTYFLDFQKRKFTGVKKREVFLRESKKIQTVIGARRTGKTYLFFDKIVELEAAGVERKRMIYLNFESPILDDVTYKELRQIIELHWSLFPEAAKKKLYLFIDEPQVIDKWELMIRDLHDNFNARIFITGSSSRLLSREIATSLRGRSISTVLLPLSFFEYLQFHNFTYEKNKIDTVTKVKLLNYFEDFLNFGAYPEIVLTKNHDERIKILKDYFDLTIYKDLVDRYSLKNSSLIRTLIDLVIGSCSKEFSINKNYLDLKSRSMKIGKETLYEYFDILADSFFVFPLKRFYHSKRQENLSIPKVYLGDIGFMNLYSMTDYGRRLENIVFLQLFRKKIANPLLEISYWKDNGGREVDFVARQGQTIKEIIQVSLDIDNINTRQREVKSLLFCMTELKMESGIIITKDQEGEEIIDGKKIKIIPIWRWLLE